MAKKYNTKSMNNAKKIAKIKKKHIQFLEIKTRMQNLQKKWKS